MQVDILTHWDEFLGSFPQEMKDIYFVEEYVRLYEEGMLFNLTLTDERTPPV